MKNTLKIIGTYLSLITLALGVSGKALSQVILHPSPYLPPVVGLSDIIPYVYPDPSFSFSLEKGLMNNNNNDVAEAFARAGLPPPEEDHEVIYIPFSPRSHYHQNHATVYLGSDQVDVCAEDRCYSPSKGLEMMLQEDIDKTNELLDNANLLAPVQIYEFNTPYTPEEEQEYHHFQVSQMKKNFSLGGVSLEGRPTHSRIVGFAGENSLLKGQVEDLIGGAVEERDLRSFGRVLRDYHSLSANQEDPWKNLPLDPLLMQRTLELEHLRALETFHPVYTPVPPLLPLLIP